MKSNLSLRRFLFLGLFIGLVLGSVSGFLEYDSSKEKIVFGMQDVLFEKSLLVKSFIDKQEVEFWKIYDDELFVRLLELQGKDGYEDVLLDVYDKFDGYNISSIGVVNASGILIADKERWFVGYDTTKEYYESVSYLKDDFFEIENTYMILPHPDSGNFYLLIMKKLFSDDDLFLGYFSYRVPDEDLTKMLVDVSLKDREIESYLVDENLYLLTPSRFFEEGNRGVLSQIVNTSTVMRCVEEDISLLKSGRETKSFSDIIDYISYSGEHVYGIYSVVEDPRWCLLVEVEEKSVLGELIRGAFLRGFVVFVFVVFVFVILGFFIDKYIFKKLV